MKSDSRLVDIHLERGQVEDALIVLAELAQNTSRTDQMEVTMLKGRLAELQRGNRMGIILRDVYEEQLQRITKSTLELSIVIKEFDSPSPPIPISGGTTDISRPTNNSPKPRSIRQQSNRSSKPHSTIADFPGNKTLEVIQTQFAKANGSAEIPLLKAGQSFQAEIQDSGIKVGNLGGQPLIPWEAFIETIRLLESQGGRSLPGDAIKGKLGDERLPLDSIEGHLAAEVFGKSIGKSVFRRISSIRGILIWTGICQVDGKYLSLVK